MLLRVCSFHPTLWRKIQRQQFAQKIFDLLLSENALPLLFNFEHFLIANAGKTEHLSNAFAIHFADAIVSLNDSQKYVSHN